MGEVSGEEIIQSFVNQSEMFRFYSIYTCHNRICFVFINSQSRGCRMNYRTGDN